MPLPIENSLSGVLISNIKHTANTFSPPNLLTSEQTISLNPTLTSITSIQSSEYKKDNVVLNFSSDGYASKVYITEYNANFDCPMMMSKIVPSGATPPASLELVASSSDTKPITYNPSSGVLKIDGTQLVTSFTSPNLQTSNGTVNLNPTLTSITSIQSSEYKKDNVVATLTFSI